MEMGADWPRMVSTEDIVARYTDVLYAFPLSHDGLAVLVDERGDAVGYVGGPLVAGFFAGLARMSGHGFDVFGVTAESFPADIINDGPFHSCGLAIILDSYNEDMRGSALVILDDHWKEFLDQFNERLLQVASKTGLRANDDR